MAVNGVSSNYSYNYGGYSSYQNSMINSDGWKESAEKEADKIKDSLGINTSGSNKTSSSSTAKATSSTSAFLMEYQDRLEDLEASASKLQTSKKDNVFDQYDKAVAEASKTQIMGEDGKPAEVSNEKVDAAKDAIVDATKDFLDQLNGTIAYLSKNSGHSSTVAFQLAGLRRTIPSDKALAKIGISVDTKGNLKMDEEKFREALEKDPGLVKDLLGGQFGMAERAGDKATEILDMSVNEILGGSASTNDTSNTNTSGGSSSVSGAAASSSKSAMSDSFRQFANFAKSGAFNLSNYYAVSMLNILV